ncbi:cysteine ligase [Planomonospora sphaerica]|uniref:Glutamate--cysteine ligase EgtA n=1 Tax=Planomonospora sphaerica TaxID=161355 RepID=A0A171DLU9_9ACTN|nr:ergothioneine biosynthesis glutamate--cysteine ligase EgtA [Planomonospora sphaerica]GAT69882.1 cysteine ligase [Planomonospora sphaerica]
MSFLTEDDVYDHVHGICFKTGPPGLTGIESEWLVTDPARPGEHVPLPRLTAAVQAASPLPSGSAVTYEPGGQLELSSPPLPGPAAARRALEADLRHLDPHLAAAGLRRTGYGLDPHRSPLRQLDLPRYTAMEAYFDARNAAGRAMMCCTASIQVCLDIGSDPADARARWRLLHRLGPVLVAAFANSPLWRGRPTGRRSTRQALWAALDPSRSRTVPDGGPDPAAAWARYALDARVMAVRRTDGPWAVDPGLTFRDWLGGGRYGRPTADDLDYHLSTLFPPVRPRGWFELRMIDALPEPWWPVPLAVAAALTDDPRAADACAEAVEPLPPDAWEDAARTGPGGPGLARAARTCFAAARDALPRIGAADLVPLVDAYIERYVEPGRCPADDLLCEVPT